MDEPTSGSKPEPATHYFALPVGTRLLEFDIESVLGHGGFGITYLALDTLLQEKVAIKEYMPNELAVRVSDATIRPKSGGDAADFEAGLQSFLEEARMVARLRQPNIVHVRRFFDQHGTGYIVQDYVEGRTLADHLKAGPLPEAALRRILSGILDGLEVVHDAAILHRDLKPSNIILRPNGTPVLIDFGAARDFRMRHSRSITAIAAPGYSPPEQYGVGQQGPWTDFYALGAIAYRCTTGLQPPDSLRRLRNDPIVPASVAAQGRYDPALLHAVDWMMALQEDQRPRSVAEVREALSKEPPPVVSQLASVSATPLTSVPRTAAAEAATQTTATQRRPKAQLVMIAAVAALLLAAVGAYFYNAGHRRQTETELRRNTEQLATVGFNRMALEAFRRTCHGGEGCPEELRKTAQSRIDTAKAEDEAFRAAQGQPQRLRAYASACVACEFRADAERQATDLEAAELARLSQMLADARFNDAALERVLRECGERCPDSIRNEVNTRTELIRAEEGRYRAATGNLRRLREYRGECRACPFTEEADASIKKMQNDAQAEHLRRKRELETAGNDPVALQRFLDQCWPDCPEDLVKEARDRLENHRAERARFDAIPNNPEGMQGYLNTCGNNCLFRAEAQARISNFDRGRLEASRQRVAQELEQAGTNQNAIERFIANCDASRCPADLRMRATERLTAIRTDQLAYFGAQGNLERLTAYERGCSPICGYRDAARRDIAQVEERRGRETETYRAARGDPAKLRAYVGTCTTCEHEQDARREYTEIEMRREQERREMNDRDYRAYQAARNDVAALEAYGQNCQAPCAFKDFAQREAADLRQQGTRREAELRDSERREAEQRELARAEQQDRERRDTEQRDRERRDAEQRDLERREAEQRERERRDAEAREQQRREEERRRLALPPGSYRAERGYTGARSRTDSTNCPPTIDFTVTVQGNTLTFDHRERRRDGSSYTRYWAGSINQSTGAIKFLGSEARPATNYALSIDGFFGNARIDSDYCGPGYFKIVKP